ncbi:MAG: tetratricopeptide repeat protein [Erythrobacter sp.]|nr:tetratricopeptide repeat protein [Erythrobacter sp.]
MKSAPIYFAVIAAVSLVACAPQVTASQADVDQALAKNRLGDAQRALEALREAEGPTQETSWSLAKVMIDRGDGYSAERYLNEITDQSSARWITLRGQSLILQGSPGQARVVVEAFKGDRPDDGVHDWLLVWAAMEEGRIPEAETLVDTALRAHRRSAPLHAKAARLSVWRDNWDAADRHIAEALEADPSNYEALLLKGESLIARGDLEGALAKYRDAAQTFPDYALARANVAGLLLDLERLDEAQAELETGLLQHPEFSLLRFNKARLQALGGQWSAARQTLQSLPHEWKRDFPAALLLEGEVEAALGNHAMARTLYARLADDPRFAEPVADLLARLPQAAHAKSND